MTFDQAVQLILWEANEMEGLVVIVRSGEDPGADRMARLQVALRVVFDSLRGQPALDRRLTSALHAFAFHVFGQATGGQRSRAWRDEFVDYEVVRLAAAVESIFEDVWEEW
jgi:hypothetical protein